MKNAETGAGEPGVTVKLSNGASAVTGADGTYSITTSPGSATMSASKSRFDEVKDLLTVSVTAGGTSTAGPITIKPQHWFNQVSGVSDHLNDVHAVDAQRAWIAGNGGTLLRTTDGGSNWLPAQSAPTADYNAIYFVSSSVGWAAGDDGKLVKSTDGGITWAEVTTNTSSDVEDVFFLNESTGWAVTYGEVLYTTDGGATWNTSTGAGGYAVSAIDATHVVVAGHYLYITTTGGLSWQRGASTTYPTFVKMFSQDEIWYGTSDGGIGKSEDGGLSFTWAETYSYSGRRVFRDPSTRQLAQFQCTNMFFVTPQVGWAVNGDGVIKKY